MADMNYVSPLTSDLTDYYTKSEVDELQQGDAATYATSAEIVAGDNAVKGWVVSQGFLTEHQDLTNYATKDYVAAAVEDIETGGVSIEVVDTLPAHPEENVIYLTRKSESDTDNIYNEWIWVADTESYELIGDTSSGVIPDLSDYATKQWVEAKGYLVSDNLIGYATVSDLADFATKDYVDDELANKANSADLAAVATSGDYDDLSNKPTIPDISNLAAADISFSNPDKYTIYDNPTVQSVLLEVDNNAVRKSRLATVATSGDYNDLSNKPSIPSTSGLASETYVDNAIAAIKGSDIDNDMNWIDEGMAKASAIDEINNNVSAAGLSGSYNDLDDKPTIPTVPTNVSSFTNDAGYLTSHQDISGKANIADLATVATTGDYDDLTNKPTIPVLPTLATVATSGDYNDLSNKPVIPSGGVSRVFAPMLNTYAFDTNGLSLIPTTIYYNSTIANHMNEVKTEFIEKVKNGEWIRFIAAASSGQFILANTDLGLASNQSFSIYRYNTNTQTFNSTSSTSTKIYTSKVYGYVGEKVLIEYPVDIYEFAGALKLLPYSNTTSGLTATTVQGAIDELAAASGGGSSVGWTYDSSTGYMTFTGMLDNNL